MAHNTAQDGELQRSLSHEQITMIALGSALGTGLFLGSGAAIGIAGPAVIISYAIGSMIAAIIACAAGEMAVRFPVRGGFGTMAGRFVSPFAGYLTQWAYWATTVSVAGAELVAVATYLNYWWPQFPLWAGILIFGVVVVLLNAYSVRSFGIVEFFLSGIKVLAVVLFILVGLLLIFFGLPGHPAAGVDNLTAGGFFPENPVHSIWLSMAIVMFSFGGIELVSISAAEAKDPVRSIRTAAKATVYRLATFYILAIFVVIALIPASQAAESGDLSHSPFVVVFDQVGIPAAASIINFIVLVAALSAANANVYAGTRLMHSLSYQGMAPRSLRYTSGYGAPVRSLAVSCVGILLVIVLAVLTEDVFIIMMSVVLTFVLVVWSMILISYIRYRQAHGKAEHFNLLGGIGVAVLAVLMLVAVFAAVFASPTMRVAGLYALGFFALIGILYLTAVRKHIISGDMAFDEAEAVTSSQPIVGKKQRQKTVTDEASGAANHEER